MDSHGFDPIYFENIPWRERLDKWVAENKNLPQYKFLEGNIKIIYDVLSDKKTGVRVLINITADALLSFISSNHYKNIYEKPVIGEEAPQVSEDRRHVDDLLGFSQHPEEYYFGAVAVGGTGVRYYGDYCIVLKSETIDSDTQVFDRDSYDLLVIPLKELVDLGEGHDVVNILRGQWDTDVKSMIAMQVAHEIQHDRKLVTAGTISDLSLRDQEFIEAHKHGEINIDCVEEIRLSPIEMSIEADLHMRRQAGETLTKVEDAWLSRRKLVRNTLELHGIPNRVVTMHGKGYQWG